MRFGSVCSGIEAASVAWHPLGWTAAWLAEIEPFPSAVLAHHYPNVPNLGDMTALPKRILLGEVEAPDLFCGGTPCQAFSVAGLRRSLDDERGNLSLTFCEIADAIDHVRGMRGQQPAVIFWENVPGVLSTADNAFGCFLAGLAGEDDPLQPPGAKWSNSGCVYGPARAVAWRVLDAQYFGVAQRRRRVFVVASARDGFDPAAVLFEFDGVRRDSAPSREAGQEAAATLAARTRGGGGLGTDFELVGGLIPQGFGGGNTSGPIDVAACLTAKGQRIDFEVETMVAQAIAFDCKGSEAQVDLTGAAPTLRAMGHSGSHANAGGQLAVAFDLRGREGGAMPEGPHDTANIRAASGGSSRSYIATRWAVRRLTPRECERLQGFPDDYTAIPWRGKPAEQCPDGPRYKALGNSWAVPVVRWIGRRIQSAL